MRESNKSIGNLGEVRYMKKKRVLIGAGAVLAVALVVVAAAAMYEWYESSRISYDTYPPYIVYDSTFYKHDGYTAHPEIREEGYTETDAVINTLVDSNVLSEEEGTTNVKGYLNGVVYVNDQYPGMIYLRLSGGEDDGKYARFYAPNETKP